MEILGKKTKILLTILLAALLTASAISFAIWDTTTTARAATGNMTKYANAKIGDIVTFGNYYQDANGTTKTPIEWLVVDKDEKSGQLTLLAKHVLAGGAYWGNWFYNSANSGGTHSAAVGSGPAGITYNQNWADSTLRAWLNNLERTDVHGDKFTTTGIQLYADKVTPSKASSTSGSALTYSYQHSDLKYSIGYSNKNHWTGISANDISGTMPTGYFKRQDNNEIYYKRTNNTTRPAVNGFLDEAFTQEEQERIVPKVIPGQICHEWPSGSHYTENKSVTPTTVDKIWAPSTAELNIEKTIDQSGLTDDGNGSGNWLAGTDNSSSDAFAFFRQFQTVDALTKALRATGTAFDRNPQVSNYSIPLDVAKTNIGTYNTQNDQNYSDYWGEKGTRYYWTRTPVSHWYRHVGSVQTSGAINYHGTRESQVGARPALILSYQ